MNLLKKMGVIMVIVSILGLVACSKESVVQSGGQPNEKQTPDKVTQESPTETTKKMTVEEIKKTYDDRAILDTKMFKDHYLLVESQLKGYASKFEFYNLKTGDKDDLPTLPNYVEFLEFKNENELIFLNTGRTSETTMCTFPDILHCKREKENTANQLDFEAVYEEYYANLDEKIIFGNKKEEATISKVDFTEKGIYFLFKPSFVAGYNNVNETTVEYEEGTNQLSFKIDNTYFDDDLMKNAHLQDGNNTFVKSVKLSNNEEGCTLCMELNQKAAQYNASQSSGENGLIHVNVNFKS